MNMQAMTHDTTSIAQMLKNKVVLQLGGILIKLLSLLMLIMLAMCHRGQVHGNSSKQALMVSNYKSTTSHTRHST